MFGASGVGKTSLIWRVLTGPGKLEEYESRLEETYQTTRSIDGTNAKLHILDSDSEERTAVQQDLVKNYFQAILLVYAVDNQQSFDMIPALKEEVMEMVHAETRSFQPVLMLVANKSDLEKERVITPEQGEQLAQSLNAFYIESASIYSDEYLAPCGIEEAVRRIRLAGGGHTGLKYYQKLPKEHIKCALQ